MNVRLGPGLEFDPPIGAIAAGQTAELLARNPTGDWYKVRYEDSDGWVFADLVTVSGDISGLPIDSGPSLPTIAPTDTPTQLPPTSTSTVTPSETVAAPAQVVSTTAPLTPETNVPSGGGIPAEAVVGGIILLIVVAYIALYLNGTAAVERYKHGFVIDRCPACDRGELTVENRINRLLGIPRPRRIVRCNECRSVLREVAPHRWRYAVDPMENSALYRHYNGREIDDATLVEIAQRPQMSDDIPPETHPPMNPPTFTDDDRD